MDYNNINLWTHQKEAIGKAETYLSSSSKKSFLIKLPTGSGKTGIIATITRIVKKDANILIVVPSIALKNQIEIEIKDRFWKKISIDQSKLIDKEIKAFTNTELPTLIKNRGRNSFIWICVTNSLYECYKSNGSEYAFLKNEVDFVIFDEGHKEPAPTWAKAVRSLEKKIILFSATPFRNDLKLFNIDKSEYYFLSHEEAIKKNVIRDIEIKSNSFNWKNNTSFDTLISEIEKERLSFGAEDARVLIRCNTSDNIRAVVNNLLRLKKKVLGIHENFASGSSLTNDVPQYDTLDKYDYVIHQNKLIEGVDFPKFLILVILGEFGNHRSLIQQIGRVTRNISLNASKKAIIYSNSNKLIQSIWSKYLAYDNNIFQYKKLYDVSDTTQLNEKIKWVYFNGEFKAISVLNKLDHNSVLIPTRVLLRTNKSSFPFKDISDLILSQLLDSNSVIIKSLPLNSNGTLVFLQSFNNSLYLSEEFFLESKFGIIIFHLIDDLLYYYSSDGIYPECLDEVLGEPNQQLLLNSLSKKERLTRLNTINSDIGKHVVKTKLVSAYSVEDSSVSLNDHSFVATYTEAIVNSNSHLNRRYVGLSRPKISDYLGDYLPYEQYWDWLKSIHSEINLAKSFTLPYLSRFAQIISTPTSLEVVNILIDIVPDDYDNFRYNDRYKFEFIDVTSEVNKGQFKLSISVSDKMKEFDCSVKFDSRRNIFIIESDELANSITEKSTKESIISYVNKKQLFRIITDKCEAFYVNGHFYSPKINLSARSNDLDIVKLLIPIKDLGNIKSEKGGKKLKALKTTWNKNTLFGLIERGGEGYSDKTAIKKHLDFDYLVCDDLNDESADFIGIKEKEKLIVLIHAKGGDSKVSASAFQEVCGQAVKNLDMLSPFNDKPLSKKITKWDGSWRHKKIGTVPKRILKGSKNATDFISLYQKMISNPETKKQVIIVTGKTLSKKELEKELAKNISNLKPEVLQLVYLLRSTWASVSSIGADLKIFCGE